MVELDDKSFDSAVHNVNSNNLQSVISVRKASSSSPILFPLQDSPKDPASRVDFTMCNPPFYSSPEEVENLAAMKDLPPNAVCTGAPIEMIYKDGGEVGFVGKMVEESLTFGTKCRYVLFKLTEITFDSLFNQVVYIYAGKALLCRRNCTEISGNKGNYNVSSSLAA